MELNSDDSTVNLDDDKDFSYSDSSNFSDDENHNQNDRVIDFEDEVNEEEVDTDEGNEAMDAEVGGEVSRRIIDLTSDDIWALEFCSENDAFNFYFSYARCHGFAVRRDDVIKDSKDVKYGIAKAGGLNVIERSVDGEKFIGDIMKLKQKYENLCSVSSTSTVEINVVHDPTMVKTKGAPTKARKRRKRKRCSNCQTSGHVITTCPRLVPPENEVNINHEVSGAESESLMRDADKVRKELHLITMSQTEAPITSQEELVTVAKQGRHGPQKNGADLEGPSPKPEKEVQQHGSVIPTTENATTVPIGFPTNMCAPTLNYQLPRGGPSSVGNIHIREGSCLAHELFPLFPTQSQVHINTQQSTNEVANHDANSGG
ncbi:protein FAR1-RELATED SEQUENCE 5-like [Sesbania bispinosa]|nr:protein FAR1-RELATED SEQUENCE 5-like [Sesbania bispinosa]